IGAGVEGLRSPRILAPIYGQLALICGFAALDTAIGFALAYSIGSAMNVLVAGQLSRLGRFQGSVRTLVIGAGFFEFVAVLSAIAVVLEDDAARGALAVAVLGLSPGVARSSFARGVEQCPFLATALVACPVVAMEAALTTLVEPSSVGAFCA